MEGDGVFCRPRCFPACNAHQKCSVPECLTETAAGEPDELPQQLPVLARLEDEGGEEEAAKQLPSLRHEDFVDSADLAALCDRPCR
jgi:hypothetical protein